MEENEKETQTQPAETGKAYNAIALREFAKYDNVLNKMDFPGMTETEWNMIMFIINQCNVQNSLEIKIPAKTAIEKLQLQKTKIYTHEVLVNRMKDALAKLGSRVRIVCIQTPEELALYPEVIFSELKYNYDTEMITFNVNPGRSYMVQDFGKQDRDGIASGGYTQIPLRDFMRTKGRYEKNLFRLLCQFRSGRRAVYQIEEFRQLMTFPEGTKTEDITKKIKILVKHLSKYFQGLGFEYIYTRRNRKKEVKAILFTWKKYSNEEEALKKYEPEKLQEYHKKEAEKQTSLPLPPMASADSSYEEERLNLIEKWKDEHGIKKPVPGEPDYYKATTERDPFLPDKDPADDLPF